MKKHAFALALALCMLAVAGPVQAANTDTITVTVCLAVVSVDLDQNAWNIGPVNLASVSSVANFTATVGNVATKLEVKATNPATNGWTIGTAPAADVFRVAVSSPALSLSTAYQVLAASVAANSSKAFGLTYYAPTGDTKGPATDQSFTITVKASVP